MKLINRLLLINLFILILPLGTRANPEQGTRGPFHITTAWNLFKGDFSFYTTSRYYFNNKSFVHNNSPTTYKDLRSGLACCYGLGKHYQIGISQIIYQDNHKSEPGYNLPDDLFLNFKFNLIL